MEPIEGETSGGVGHLRPASRNKNKFRVADWVLRNPIWNQSAASRRVWVCIILLMASGLTYSVLAHPGQHNSDGSHKTALVEARPRRAARQDGGATQTRIHQRPAFKIQGDGTGGAWLGAVGIRRRPECVGKPALCSHRRVDGLCRRRWELCRYVPAAASGDDVFPAAVVLSCIGELKQMLFWQADEIARLRRDHEKHDRNLQAVAKNQFELLKENEELRRLNKEGYFNFAVRVKGEDFLAFAVIMALGNRKAAAEHLNIPARTLYSRVSHWMKRGKDYQLMCRYMDWRKRSSRHLKVDLNPSLQTGESEGQPENPDTMGDVLTEIQAAADNKSYPALLSDILQALERQNAGNWQSVRAELIEIIKAELC